MKKLSLILKRREGAGEGSLSKHRRTRGFYAAEGVVISPAPFGVRFTGRAFSEPAPIALAYAYEAAASG